MAELVITATPNLFAAPFSYRAKCLSSDAVGDCIYVSGDPIGTVQQVAKADVNDPDKMPARGVIVSKSSATDCIVVYLGGTP